MGREAAGKGDRIWYLLLMPDSPECPPPFPVLLQPHYSHLPAMAGGRRACNVEGKVPTFLLASQQRTTEHAVGKSFKAFFQQLAVDGCALHKHSQPIGFGCETLRLQMWEHTFLQFLKAQKLRKERKKGSQILVRTDIGSEGWHLLTLFSHCPPLSHTFTSLGEQLACDAYY